MDLQNRTTARRDPNIWSIVILDENNAFMFAFYSYCSYIVDIVCCLLALCICVTIGASVYLLITQDC